MKIRTNFPALTAFTSLNSTNKSLQKTIRSLSTGLRINSASDDAAGFAVSQKMRSQISGLETALRNSQDGVSMLQTAEGALSQTNALLQRMRELSIQAASDSLTSQDRQYLQLEVEELKGQIDLIAGTTEFNGKKILDGSAGALWSSSDVGVKARINGGLEYTDSSGQRVSSEGNYRIDVSVEPGQPQVQKSNVFNLDVQENITRVEYVPGDGQIATKIDIEQLSSGDSGPGWSFDGRSLTLEKSGSYAIVGTNQQLTDRSIKVSGTAEAVVYMSDVNISVSSGSAFELENGAEVNMYLKGSNYLKSGDSHAGIEAPKGTALSISSTSGDGSTDGTLEVHGGVLAAGIGGASGNTPTHSSSGAILISGETIKAYGGNQSAGIGGASDNKVVGGGEVTITGGYIEAYGGSQGAGIGSGHAAGVNANTLIKIAGGTIKAYGGGGGYYSAAGIGGGCHSSAGTILIKEGLVQWLDKENGIVAPDSYPVFAQRGCGQAESTSQDIGHGAEGSGSVGTLTTDIPTSTATGLIPTAITDVSVRPSSIRDIKNFYNSDGLFLLDTPQTITITQGNGKTAQVTLYESDSMYDIAERINNAIADGLEQKVYADSPNNFCTIASGTGGTSESAYLEEDVYRPKYQRDDNGNLVLDKNNNPILIGREKTGTQVTYSTMLVRSAIPGKEGELYFSGDQDLLNALGLNTIQPSTESVFTASVYDAHSGTPITTANATGPEFVSLIPPEIDIEVDAMSALSANWDDTTKRFIMARKKVYTAFLHLKNNGTIFQTGANGGDDFLVQLGSMSASSLGLRGVNVLTRETASRAISTLDRAIQRVSVQRAKIGAYTNALEHTIANLTTTSTNLADSESRIRDADIAESMMDFVKFQILNQSGISMLSQANQLPESILGLLQN